MLTLSPVAHDTLEWVRPLEPRAAPPLVCFSAAADYAWWCEPAPRLASAARAEFWAAHPALTGPQFAARLLSRPLEAVSFFTIDAATGALRGGRHAADWQRHRLREYPTLWARTHDHAWAWFDPRRLPAPVRADAAHPFAQIAGWATSPLRVELRYLVAGLPRTLALAARERRARALFAEGLEGGWLAGLRTERLPLLVYEPQEELLRGMGVPRRRVDARVLDHNQLAVEASLALVSAGARATPPLAAIRTEPELTAALRRALFGGRGIGRGDVLPPTPDAEVETADGARHAVEVLSRSYRDPQVRAKVAALGWAPHARVSYVATTARLARRAVGAVREQAPGFGCFFF